MQRRSNFFSVDAYARGFVTLVIYGRAVYWKWEYDCCRENVSLARVPVSSSRTSVYSNALLLYGRLDFLMRARETWHNGTNLCDRSMGLSRHSRVSDDLSSTRKFWLCEYRFASFMLTAKHSIVLFLPPRKISLRWRGNSRKSLVQTSGILSVYPN